jgi:hypothetical protein
VKDYEAFFKSFVEKEYQLWQICYQDTVDDFFWKARDRFQEKFYSGPDLETEIRRMKNPDKEWLEDAKEYLAVTFMRKIFQVKALINPKNPDETVYLAYISTKQKNSKSYFELAIASQFDGQLKIISSYITNHAGWFEYNMGIDFGELKPPLNALEVIKYMAPENEADLEEYDSE